MLQLLEWNVYILLIMLSDTITRWQVLTVSNKVNAVLYPIRCFNYWHFASFALHLIPEPTTVDIHVDGLNDVCTKEQDINFFFTGFSVLGTVREIFLPAVFFFMSKSCFIQFNNLNCLFFRFWVKVICKAQQEWRSVWRMLEKIKYFRWCSLRLKDSELIFSFCNIIHLTLLV